MRMRTHLQSSLPFLLSLLAHHAALAAPRKSSIEEFVVDKAAIAKHEPAFDSFDGDIFAGHIPMRQRRENGQEEGDGEQSLVIVWL